MKGVPVAMWVQAAPMSVKADPAYANSFSLLNEGFSKEMEPANIKIPSMVTK